MTSVAPYRVLVVDDEDDLRHGLAALLGRIGADVRLAADGTEALAAAAETPFDVVVSDLRMPHMSGTELLPRLLALRPPPAVVIVTGYATVQAAVVCLQGGAVDFLTKPFDNDEVLRVVERAARRVRLQRAAPPTPPSTPGPSFAAGTPPEPPPAAAECADYNVAKQRAVEAFQNEFVRRVLDQTGGNVSQAAERCGLARTALQKIMRRIGYGPTGK